MVSLDSGRKGRYLLRIGFPNPVSCRTTTLSMTWEYVFVQGLHDPRIWSLHGDGSSYSRPLALREEVLLSRRCQLEQYIYGMPHGCRMHIL